MKITYLDGWGDECSIIQEMSKKTIGTWVWYFIEQGYKVVGIEEVKENENN